MRAVNNCIERVHIGSHGKTAGCVSCQQLWLAAGTGSIPSREKRDYSREDLVILLVLVRGKVLLNLDLSIHNTLGHLWDPYCVMNALFSVWCGRVGWGGGGGGEVSCHKDCPRCHADGFVCVFV